MTWTKAVACFAVLTLLTGTVFTQDVGKDKPPKDKTAAKEETKPATHKVQKKPFKIEITIKGILEAQETADISYRPQPMVQPPPSQGPLVIRTVAPHGAKVKKGDILAAFDRRKIDEVIDDLEVEKKVLETGIKLAEEELPLFQKSVPVDLAAAETAKKRADEDLKYFLDVGKGQYIKEANNYLKMAKFYLEFSQEELRQLEKMYKANDLTEDTEKIILKRQRYYVEMAKFMVESAVLDHDYTMKFSLPNKEKAL